MIGVKVTWLQQTIYIYIYIYISTIGPSTIIFQISWSLPTKLKPRNEAYLYSSTHANLLAKAWPSNPPTSASLFSLLFLFKIVNY